MLQPGRKAGAALATVAPALMELPEPPENLTEPQADVWRTVVASKPVDWFLPDTLPLLSAYCKATVEHQRVSALLDAFNCECLKDEDGAALERYDKLTKLQDRQARLMMSLATKMRLTQQSRYRADEAHGVARKAGRARPWGPAVVPNR